MAILRTPSKKRAEAIAKPYLMEIGGFAVGWNLLHEDLADLFCCVLGAEASQMPMAIWHCVANDRLQRDLLRAAISAENWQTRGIAAASAKLDMLWLLERTDALATKRNDALHAPFAIVTSQRGTHFEPSILSSSPRAKNLRNKNLMSELKLYNSFADQLIDFVRQICSHFRHPDLYSWPKRPTMPSLKT